MTQQQYGNAQANMAVGIEKYLNNKYIKSIVPDQIILTLQLLVDFIGVVKLAIFRDGKILELSIWNVLRWWNFVKLAHQFVKDIINVWK